MASLFLTKEQSKYGASLHHRDVRGETLTDDEKETLLEFRRTIEAEEADSLRASAQRQEAHIAWLEARNRDLEGVVARQKALVERLRTVLAEAEREGRTIAGEYQHLVQTPEPVR